jgi:hypothetical protein
MSKFGPSASSIKVNVSLEKINAVTTRIMRGSFFSEWGMREVYNLTNIATNVD